MTLYLFGGTFNPVHLGHLALIHALRAARPGADILVIPNRQSPFKQGARSLPDDLRQAMLEAALHGIPGVRVSDVELCRPAPSYTVDTVQALRQAHPGAQLRWVMGADAFAEFPRWRNAGGILAQAGLTVFARAGGLEAPPASMAAWRAWTAQMPAPWCDAAPGAPPPPDAGQGGVAPRWPLPRLLAPDQRLLVEWIPAALPEVAASEILRSGNLDAVPAAARPLLRAHLAREEQGADR